jgi:hypothetical protein
MTITIEIGPKLASIAELVVFGGMVIVAARYLWLDRRG